MGYVLSLEEITPPSTWSEDPTGEDSVYGLLVLQAALLVSYSLKSPCILLSYHHSIMSERCTFYFPYTKHFSSSLTESWIPAPLTLTYTGVSPMVGSFASLSCLCVRSIALKLHLVQITL